MTLDYLYDPHARCFEEADVYTVKPVGEVIFPPGTGLSVMCEAIYSQFGADTVRLFIATYHSRKVRQAWCMACDADVPVMLDMDDEDCLICGHVTVERD